MPIFDDHELHTLAADLTGAGVRAAIAAVPVMRKAGQNIMETARASSAGLKHAPRYPQSITYDTTVEATGVTVEVGPDKGRPQGALGNLIEYGSVHNPPHNDLGAAFDAEAPRAEVYLGELGAKAI